MQSPKMPTTCDRCGTAFNTSQDHPRRYCSIACEEGRGPLPESDPRSPDFHLHVQGNPKSLIGKAVVANGLKRTCYSPDWHKMPHQYDSRRRVDHDSEEEILVLTDDVYLGKVVDYRKGKYVLEKENLETGDILIRGVQDSTTVAQLRRENWRVDG